VIETAVNFSLEKTWETAAMLMQNQYRNVVEKQSIKVVVELYEK
jgi:hypothetical protein